MEEERKRVIQIIKNYPLAADFELCEVSPCRECNAIINFRAQILSQIEGGLPAPQKATLSHEK